VQRDVEMQESSQLRAPVPMPMGEEPTLSIEQWDGRAP
jgi:hypothetical protein